VPANLHNELNDGSYGIIADVINLVVIEEIVAASFKTFARSQ
jgi:hypothetical protein